VARSVEARTLSRLVARPWLVAALSALLAGALTSWNAFGYPQLHTDEGQMVGQAWGILHGDSHAALSSFGHLPGAPWLLAGWDRLLGLLGHVVPGIVGLTQVQQGRLLLVVFSAIEAPLLYLIVRRFTGHDLLAFGAVVLLVLSPLELWYARRLGPDPFAAFWTVLALFFATPATGRRRWSVPRVLLAGLCLGMAMCSKEVAVVTVPGFVLLCLAWPKGRRLLATGLFLVGAAVVPAGVLAWAHGSLPHAAARSQDGGILNPSSQFWAVHSGWSDLQPFFLLLTIADAVWLTVFASTRARRALGLMALGYWVVFASGLAVHDRDAAAALPIWVAAAVVGAWDFVQRDFVQKRLWGLGPLSHAGGAMACAAVLLLAPAIPADAKAFTGTDAAVQTQLTVTARRLVPAEAAFVDDGNDSVDLQQSTSLPGHRLPLSCNYLDTWCLRSPHLTTAFIVDGERLRSLARQDPSSYAGIMALIGRGRLVWSAHDVDGGDLRLYMVHIAGTSPG